jgi:peptidoglycan/xylan/chitin deacetylase (PgdA/CDA1 family)/glycine betaine/choline ABC-type transport system substrate-binding protein
LQRFYGVDLSGGLVESQSPADSALALKFGEVDLAILPASSPEAQDPELVLLDDDRQLLGRDHYVLLHRRELGPLYGPALRTDLEWLGQQVTLPSLRTLRARLRGDEPLDAVASAWLATLTPAEAPPVRAGGLAIVVGSWGPVEHRFLAEALVRFLADRGYPAIHAPQAFSSRSAALAALADGMVNVLPESAGSLLEHLNGKKGEAVADEARTAGRLNQYLGQFGVRSTSPSPGGEAVVFAVPRLAEGDQLHRLSDLRGVTATVVPPTAQPSLSSRAELAVPIRLSPRDVGVGASGPEVVAAQLRLRQLGYAIQPEVILGPQTADALAAFQSARGLDPTGELDPITQRALDRAALPPSGLPSDRVAYLTFDDGPDPRFTPAILNLLDRFDATATFFVLGNMIDEHPDLAAAISRRGHAIGNHSHDHVDLRRVGADRVRKELQATTTAIRRSAHVPTSCMRPPYGAIDDEVRDVTSQLGLVPVLWDVDTEDWTNPGVETIVERSLAGARPGVVILLHDGGGDQAQTVAATAILLERLTEAGYHFESLPQC